MAPELKRVTKYVVEFVKRALVDNKEFTARDLRLYVSLKLGGELASAPASADRIMRDQRKKGNINYELVSRAKSLYRALPVIAAVEEAKYQTEAVERKMVVTVPPPFNPYKYDAPTRSLVPSASANTNQAAKVDYVTYYGSDKTETAVKDRFDYSSGRIQSSKPNPCGPGSSRYDRD